MSHQCLSIVWPEPSHLCGHSHSGVHGPTAPSAPQGCFRRSMLQVSYRCCSLFLGCCLLLLCSPDGENLLPPFPPTVLQHVPPFATFAQGRGSGSHSSGISWEVQSTLNYAHQAALLARERAAASLFSPPSSSPPGKGHTGDTGCTQQGEGFTNAVATCMFPYNNGFSSPERQLSCFPVAAQLLG